MLVSCYNKIPSLYNEILNRKTCLNDLKNITVEN